MLPDHLEIVRRHRYSDKFVGDVVPLSCACSRLMSAAAIQIIPAMVALAINAVISTQFQFIDAWAHLGGFVGGLVLSSLYLTISCLSLRLARC
eukprot:scaffold1115_cov390-Prasinococcus_capsulatus_cf.AAC.9